MTEYNTIEIVKKKLEDLLLQMGIKEFKIEYEESVSRGLVFNIFSIDSRWLIGRQGCHLHALQMILQSMVSRELKEMAPRFFLDVDDYKMKREWFLKESAQDAADKAKQTGRSQALEPMPNFERRFIHAYIQENLPDVFSESSGEEPYRKVVIKAKK